MRNCNGKYPEYNFRLQLLNNSIIRECPNTYFESFIFQLYNKYTHFKICKILGILNQDNDLPVLELDCYGIIESETNKADQKMMEKQTKKKQGTSNGRSRN